jgi:hypothetical protein
MNSVQLVINHEIHEVKIKEYQGQRVVSLRDVDILHRRPSGTANRTFRSNSKFMIEDEDYFRRNTSEAIEEFGIKAPNGLILLTESGYLLLVKTFTDELAWTVQRQLIKTYFKAKEHFAQVEVVQPQQQIPNTIEDILMLALGSMKEMKTQLQQVQQDNRKLSLIVDNEIHLTDQQCAEVQEAVKSRVGHFMKQGHSAHFKSIYTALNTFFTVPKYNKIRRGDFDKAIDFIKGWYPRKNEENG